MTHTYISTTSFTSSTHRMIDDGDTVTVLAGIRYQNTDLESYTFNMYGDATLNNNGHIGSIGYIAVDDAESGNSFALNNIGIIEGRIDVSLSSLNDYSPSADINNAGNIYGEIQMSGGGAAMRISNTGNILSQVLLDGFDGSMLITNHGNMAGYIGIDSFQSAANQEAYVTIFNHGRMTGGVEVTASDEYTSAAVRFINSGMVKSVSLGNNDDVFRTIGLGFTDEGVYGGGGNDRLIGGQFSDTLSGDAGRDVLAGRQDDDYLLGGAGADRLYGGSGEDVFAYLEASDSRNASGVDVIYDFNRDQDVLDLENLVEGEITYIDDNRFSGKGDAEVRCVIDKRRVMHVYADLNGDGDQDFHITLRRQGGAILNDDDFLL